MGPVLRARRLALLGRPQPPCHYVSKGHVRMSLPQTHRDKWMKRERENKEQVERRNDRQATVGSRVWLKLSSLTYKLRSAIIFYAFKDTTPFFRC